MFFYQFLRWQPFAILDFLNCEILLCSEVQDGKMHHRATFCQNQSICYGNVMILQFFMVAAVCQHGYLKC